MKLQNIYSYDNKYVLMITTSSTRSTITPLVQLNWISHVAKYINSLITPTTVPLIWNARWLTTMSYEEHFCFMSNTMNNMMDVNRRYNYLTTLIQLLHIARLSSNTPLDLIFFPVSYQQCSISNFFSTLAKYFSSQPLMN